MDNVPNAFDKKKLAKIILTKLNAQKADINKSIKITRKEGSSFLDIGRNYRYL